MGRQHVRQIRKGATMDARRNKQNLQRLYDEVMNDHRIDAADELITPDRPDHDPNLPPEFTEGRDGFKRLFEMFIEAFPDFSFRNEHMVAEGDPSPRTTGCTGPIEARSWGSHRPAGRSLCTRRTCVGSPMTD
jgi:SnoaL-like polyketide cyclase